VLEIGAGTGLNLPHYAVATRVVAVEPDAVYARRLRTRARAAQVPVAIVAGRAELLPFPDATFDHAVTSLALCSVDDLDSALHEIRRVLRPGGSLVFLEHVRGEGRVARWQDRLTPAQRCIAGNCHLNRDTPAAIERAGFRLDELERFSLAGGHTLTKPGAQGVAIKTSS
jgi:ubiquinone/menaquinone biosynthesis C-methylase UbiE